MPTVAELLQTKPAAAHGAPVGLGDWRLAVEILLPGYEAGRWDVSRWDVGPQWSSPQWFDVSEYVTGLDWQRGTTNYGGRPEVGVLNVTLDNTDRIFSPWNASSAFQGGTLLDSSGFIRAGYLGPGSVIRVVAHSPSGLVQPFENPSNLAPASPDSWVPQFAGIVESWADEIVGLGAGSTATIVAVETLSALAKVDQAAVAPVGLDDLPAARLQRLLDAAAWRFGAVDASGFVERLATSNYLLQSTAMAGNRLSELYLTADSVGGEFRTDRSGRPVFYNAPDDGGLPATRGPDPIALLALYPRFKPAAIPPNYQAGYVPDSLRIANDDEIVENTITMSFAGGATRTGVDPGSLAQHDRRTFSRSDLICKSDALVDRLIARRLATRTNPLRVASLTLHSENERSIVPIIGLDIGNAVNVYLPELTVAEVATISARWNLTVGFGNANTAGAAVFLAGVFYLNDLDALGVDRSTSLAAILPGDVIEIGGWSYTVTAVTDNGTHYRYDGTPTGPTPADGLVDVYSGSATTFAPYFAGASVAGLRHRVTPKRSSWLWTCDVTFGVQSAALMPIVP